MSRTRIVKGKITEIVGGDLRYYSEADITESASEIYAEQSAGNILHGGNPGNPPPTPTLAKCAVFFRPQKNWNGEYGFDWVRVSDSKLQVDNPYNGIIGMYGKVYATDRSDPKNLPKFTVDNNKYKNILSEYTSFTVYKGSYYVPNMTLKEGETAILNALVHIEEKPDKLHYAYNTDIFEITILRQFTVSKGINFDENSVQIKCKKAFSSPETIRVIATKNNRMEKVGEIKLLPNNILSAKILIIPVKYNGKSGSLKFTQEKDYIKNSFSQSLIISTIEDYPYELTLGNWWSDLFFTTENKNGEKVMDMSSMRSIHRYLDESFMKIKGNNKYSSYYRVYCLPSSLNLNGVAEDVGNSAKAVIVFQNRENYTTMIHEIFHAAGLHHTFDNDSKYTFELHKTDNIMDYTHQIGKKRFTTNIWQWKILNKNI